MINILSKETIDQIAAGEVAESPRSVVKELIDNAVDAGAAQISVELRGAGTDLIRVTDDGSGIEKADVRPAFLRHATSKLKDAEDLIHITTMGFRGEALASVSAVSKLEMVTRTPGDLTGTLISIEGGEEKSMREVGAPVGTTIAVRDFLYNVPARRKFLKSAKTETAHVVSLVEAMAMAHPKISFSLIIDGKPFLNTPGNGRLKDVIFTLYGSQTASGLLELSLTRGSVSVSGFVSQPSDCRRKRDREFFFVNGRSVNDLLLRKALEDAFSPYLMQHTFPAAFMNVTLPPGELDCNIHPAKKEVRFSDSPFVYLVVFEAVTSALKGRELISDALSSVEKRVPERFVYSGTDMASETLTGAFPGISGDGAGTFRAEPFEKGKAAQHLTKLREEAAGFWGEEEREVSVPLRGSQESFVNIANEPYIRYIGQVFDTYLMFEMNDAFYMMDQHAAHEKINYERYVSELGSGSVSSQMIFPPIAVTLSAAEALFLDKNLGVFFDAGYEIEFAGDRDFIVRAVPAFLPHMNDETLVRELISGVFEEKKEVLSEVLKDRIASISCKAAIKGGQKISDTEAKELIKKLMSLEDPYHCPHGRPTILRWSKYQIEKLFKRIV